MPPDDRPDSTPPSSPSPGERSASGETVTLVMPSPGSGPDFASSADAPREGLALGPVALVRPVGRGGMGVVWLGHHRLLGRQVAVKFLSAAAEYDEPGFARFLAEARAAAAVRHPNLVPVHDAGLLGRTPYLVMEYVAGPTLRQVIRHEGRLDLPTALLVLEDVAAAVDELHRQGIIHRDLKPANVLMSPAGTALVSDFGLALRRPHAVGSSAAVPLAGTPAYMAPEAFAGEASARGDVYALGVTVFEMLAGSPPFPADAGSPTTREGRLAQPLPVEALRAAGVPDAAVDAVERAAHPRPLFRYKTAADLLRALRDAAGDKGPVAEPRKRALLAAVVGRCEEPSTDGDPTPPSGGTPGAVTSAASPSPYFETIARLSAQKREQHRRLAEAQTPAVAPDPPPLPPVPVEPERLPEGVIGRDVPCRRCGFNLRAVRPSARCPDCAWPAEQSLRVYAAVHSPAFLAGLRRLIPLLVAAAVFLWAPGANWVVQSGRSDTPVGGLRFGVRPPAEILFGAARYLAGGADSTPLRPDPHAAWLVPYLLLIAVATFVRPDLPPEGGRPSFRDHTRRWAGWVGAAGLVLAAILLLVIGGAAALVYDRNDYPGYRSLYRLVGPCLLGLAPLTFACFHRTTLAARTFGRPGLAFGLRAVTFVATVATVVVTILALNSAWVSAALDGRAQLDAPLAVGDALFVHPALAVTFRAPASEALAWAAHVFAGALALLTLATAAAAVLLLARLRRRAPRPPAGPVPVQAIPE